MSREEVFGEAPGESAAPSEALTAPDPVVALRKAAALWAEQNTLPETLTRAEKLRDKVSAVTSFFDLIKKHPGEITPRTWRAGARRWRGGA